MPVLSYNREWSPSLYRVENPDGIRPASRKGAVLMRYSDTHIPAATWYEGSCYKVAAFGFPLETSREMEGVIRAVLGKF